MDTVNLKDLAAEALTHAADSQNGRFAHSVLNAHSDGMGQTLIAMTIGSGLPEHEAPTTATLQCLHGKVRLLVGDQAVEVGEGHWIRIPDRRHALEAIEDSAVLLTTLP